MVFLIHKKMPGASRPATEGNAPACPQELHSSSGRFLVPAASATRSDKRRKAGHRHAASPDMEAVEVRSHSSHHHRRYHAKD
jgi:hypothetical protein